MALRILLFGLGIMFNAIGVALAAKALLGISPIAAIPYTLSLCWPVLTLGNWTILFSLLLILAQAAIQGRQADIRELCSQCIITVLFGYLIDAAMFCLEDFTPEQYWVQLFSLVSGCVIIAFGVYLAIIANVTMLPGDAFIKTIAQVSGKGYGPIRILSDVAMTLSAVLVGWIMGDAATGVREGTVIAALITGAIVKAFMTHLRGLTRLLLAKSSTSDARRLP